MPSKVPVSVVSDEKCFSPWTIKPRINMKFLLNNLSLFYTVSQLHALKSAIERSSKWWKVLLALNYKTPWWSASAVYGWGTNMHGRMAWEESSSLSSFSDPAKNLYENFGHNKNNKRELLIFYVRSGLIYQFIGIFVGKKGITEFYLVKIRYDSRSVFFIEGRTLDLNPEK